MHGCCAGRLLQQRSEPEGKFLEAYEDWVLRERCSPRLRFGRELLMIPEWRVVGAWQARRVVTGAFS